MALPWVALSPATLLMSIFILSDITNCKAQQQEGDSCVVNNLRGICTRLQQCQPAYENALNKQFPNIVCGYLSFEPIVCCPRNNERTRRPINSTLLPVTERKGTKATSKCLEMIENIPKFIIGGTRAHFMEFTFMAAVGFGDTGNIAWLCGGSLISQRFIVTAAHCTYNVNWGSANWVRLGALNLETANNDGIAVDFRVIERINHPSYKRPSEYHDIALLKLEKDVRFGPYIKPCCLANFQGNINKGKAIAMGWGQVDWAGENSNDLLKVTLDLVPNSECNRTFTNGIRDDKLEFGIIKDWQLCAGGLGKDTCQGDSGGPLVILNETRNVFELIGVTSLGKLCGSITPGIYTRVYNYVSWIEDIVWPNS